MKPKVLLINYDNADYVGWFPQSLGAIAGALEYHHYPYEIADFNIEHTPYESLANILYEYSAFRVVCVSACGGYWQYQQAKKIIGIINQLPNRKNLYLAVGGHLFAPDIKYFLDKWNVDCVCIADGEAWVKNLEVILENRVEVCSADTDIWKYRTPWVRFATDQYRLMRMPHIEKTEFCLPILSSRGCPFNCTFCYRLDKRVRLRPLEDLDDEVKYLKRAYNISYFAFADELVMHSPRRTAEICDVMGKYKVKWDCNGRLNFANKSTLKEMKDAGCVFINYGIEALDDDVLKLMRKNLDVQTIIEGVENTLRAGISPGLNILWGSPGDNRETLWKAVDFLLQYDDHAQLRTIRPVTPYPGSQLYKDAVEKGMIDDIEDFYENKHKNSDLFTCNFMDMPLEEANKNLCAANKRLIREYFQRTQTSYEKQAEDLYFGKNQNFRGFRQR